MKQKEVTFTIPMTKDLLASEANIQREHWKIKKNRHDAQQWLIESYMDKYLFFVPGTTNNGEAGYYDSHEPEEYLPCLITITRIAPRALDWDNLLYSLKWITDGICGRLIPGLAPGRADGDKRISIQYGQEKGGVREYALRVTIFPQ